MSLDLLQVLFGVRKELGKEAGFVVVLNVVDAFEGFQVVRSCVLDLFKKLLVVKVKFPDLAIVVVIFVVHDVLADQALHLRLLLPGQQRQALGRVEL